MLQIGEFSGLTGLSVKALRHYDELGVLPPARVDASTGHRFYGADQVRTGVTIRALRQAGVALPDVASSIANSAELATLAVHWGRVTESRRAEDEALATARRQLAQLVTPLEVIERQMPAQPFAAMRLLIPASPEDQERVDDHARRSRLIPRLITQGAGPSGPSWTASRARDAETTEVTLYWPTSKQLPPDWAEPGEFVGHLPERLELAASWRFDPDATSTDHLSGPAVVAIFEALAARDTDVRDIEIRQTISRVSPSGHTVEAAVTLKADHREVESAVLRSRA